MKKITIDKIEKYNHYLHDENGKKYILNIEFYDVKESVKEGDYFYTNESNLINHAVLSFGPINGKYGKEITSTNDKDLLILVSNNKRIYLKRYYG